MAGAAQNDFVQRRPVSPGIAVHQRLERQRGKIVGAHGRERSVELADRGTDIRREPDLPEQEEIVSPQRSARAEFEFHESDDDNDAARARAMKRMRRAARQASLDPDDGVEL
jgi:hypothetical protein